MWTSNKRANMFAAVLAAALVGGGLAACGSDNGDGGGDAGTVSDTEYLGHQLREVAADGAPSLEIDVEADEHGGWNLHLVTEGFTFTPGQVGDEASAGEGHAHIYVDDTKFSRIYSEWFHLPSSAVGEGGSTLEVTLNADDHTVWAVDGEAVGATATVTGAGDGHDHGTEPPSPSPSPSPDEDVELLEFEIADGSVEPSVGRTTVDRGATVRVVVTSDEAAELHLHGYDLHAHVAPGEEGVIEFVADQTGLFELETHETGLVLTQLAVQ